MKTIKKTAEYAIDMKKNKFEAIAEEESKEGDTKREDPKQERKRTIAIEDLISTTNMKNRRKRKNKKEMKEGERKIMQDMQDMKEQMIKDANNQRSQLPRNKQTGTKVSLENSNFQVGFLGEKGAKEEGTAEMKCGHGCKCCWDSLRKEDDYDSEGHLIPKTGTKVRLENSNFQVGFWGKKGVKQDEQEICGECDEKENRKNRTPITLIMPLGVIYPQGINALNEENSGWRKVTYCVDSGAGETVMPLDEVPEVELKESHGSKIGVKYESACGTTIPNEGEKEVVGLTENGWKVSLVTQVCDVHRPLLSVSKLNKMGKAVVFDGENSRILDKVTGAAESIRFNQENGCYELDVWVPTSMQTKAGFTRQG